MRLAKECALLLFLLSSFGATALKAQQSASLTGTITDAVSEEALSGATAVLNRVGEAGIVGGGVADIDGIYRITGIAPGAYTLTVRFVGYNEYRTPVTLAAGQAMTMDVQLTQGGLDLTTIVISASRQAEKVLDAPASISVLDAREIEQEVVPSSVSVLRNTTGVDIAQTGIDRNEVVLRGFNNAFSGAAYILTDYRQTAVPSLNVNIHSIMPSMPIDLERIEVVRGPGSALYGAGVDAGVIHYITKDPFSYPGTTISLTGGERALYGGQFRHAGVVGQKFGYKITGFYSQADDWEFDPNDPQDAFQLSLDAPGLQRNYNFKKYNANGMMQYRIGDGVTLTVNGGFSGLDAVVLSGIGTLQGDGFQYAYGQLRLQAGRFFAQGYLSQNDAGKSFVYGTGMPVVDNGQEYNVQAQYDFDLARERVRVIVGGDVQITHPDTEGTILGRNEANDELQEIGGYAQSTIELTSKLDLTAAVRGDYSNIFDFRVSPRAALVFKADPQNTFRASYNRSFSSPTSNSLFLDIVGQATQLDAQRKLLILGRGSADGFTFNTFRATNSAMMFLPVVTPQFSFFGTEFNVDAMPLIPIYGVAAGGGLVDLLRSQAPLPVPLTDQQRGFLADLLGYTALNGLIGASATTGATQLGIPDDSDDGYRPVNGPIDIEPLKQTTTQTVEVGYKGLINDNILFAVDGYWANKKDFVGPLLVETPLVYLQQNGLTIDVATSLATLFGTTTDPTVQALLNGLNQTGLPAANVAQLLGGLVGGALSNTPIAVVQSDQDVLAPGTQNAVGGFAAYRNFGNLNYWGVDASLQVLATDELSFFGNASYVNDNFFDNIDLDEQNVDLQLALNAPRLKIKAGGAYQFPSGLQLNVSGRYTDGFPVRSGSDYIGNVDDYFLLDVGAGYDFRNSVRGLRLDFTIQNVLDNKHREFVGAPKLGRLGLVRLIYTIE